MKLYFVPGACSLSPHIVLRELGLPFDLDQVDPATKKTKSGQDFNAINPKSYVPSLALDNGTVLTEGPAIVQYLADLKPNSNLVPAAGTLERYKLQEWLNFISTELHKGFSPLFNPATPDAYKEIAKKNLAKRLDYLNQHLAKNTYLMGNNFTVADAYCFVVLRWADNMKIDLSQWQHVKAYKDRIATRPKVQEAMKAEGLQAAA